MDLLSLLGLIVFSLLLLLLALWTIRFCLRAAFGTRDVNFRLEPRDGVFDRNYLRTMGGSGSSALSEQIELDEMLSDPVTYEQDNHDQMGYKRS
ncbi:hypothetical protein H112_03731 [Trichophyton rubrum D6]|uniref:Uncharacterized protein n=3 Tax=Trichophyton TaxID=5550 RepID=F2SR43_TRIRC|nr:uncharacterized protein TERG_08847 [Trichophyton rubrum CBS 118892]EZF23651.1 hypothetical protein H100_03739 [Trichophyton rubrum MR850]EZF42686.1 hypothetical protein H102_03729 [Trichophyton rubrum CBS 100081]EZF53315.1 hypothetical protein H103_03742 [Trichophyton rubrum CBS 288.86]EZF63928.1 hypothetical protein H104_03727 [Trichophyton rubrum CBS 289.86]EZF74555.1 hypothetical protein H105_03756 [Trichophyton soudanense CBS 452.61]EZF85249.1 hypothetical protein H110_03740 [Trichophy